MAWIEKLIKFIQDNFDLIKENVYTFLIFAIICISLTLLVNKIINSSKDKKIKKLNGDIEKLNQQLETVQSQYENLQNKFKEISINQRLLAGANVDRNSPLAKNMSMSIQQNTSD